MEHADYMTLRAPRPTLMCIAKQDFFDEAGAWSSFREATLLYGLLGHGERVALFERNDKHGFSRPRREAAMRWMRRWLLKQDDAPAEGDFPVFSDQQLQCTRTGQVLEDFHGKSVTHFNAEAARDLAFQRARRQGERTPAELLGDVRRLLGLPTKVAAAKVQRSEAAKWLTWRVHKTVFETEPGILVPGLHITPRDPAPAQPLVVYLADDGMARATQPGGPLEELLKAGKVVLALDLRGLGETRSDKGRGDLAKHFGSDWQEAFLGQHLARPLLGQRVQDVLAVIEALAKEGQKEVEIVGVGTTGPVALHAAALDARIARAVIERSVISWSAVAAAPVSKNQLTSAVHGVLKVYDLPELAGLSGPRPLAVRRALDPTGRELSQAELEVAYAPCRAAYQRLHALQALTLKASP
jgi:hypothetical protein